MYSPKSKPYCIVWNELPQALPSMSIHIKTEYMCFHQKSGISTQSGSSLKLVDKFTYLKSSVSSTEKDIDTQLTKAWTAIDRYGSQIWPIKWNAASSKQRSCRYSCMDALHGRWLNGWRKSLTGTTQECCEQFWTSPGGNTPQSTNYTATYLPSRRQSKLDEPYMQDTAGETGTSSEVMFSYGPPRMADQKPGDQLEPTYSSSVRIRDVALRACQKRWTIGRSGESGSGISVLVAGQDDEMMILQKGQPSCLSLWWDLVWFWEVCPFV